MANPPREEAPLVELVRELLGTFSKAQRDYKTYPRNNPILARRRDELTNRLTGLLASDAEIVLEVTADELRYRQASVYRSADPRESLAFHLYRHGLRELSFEEGIRADEIEAFIDVINADFGDAEVDDDLVTLLWERDLRHIHYVAVDDIPEGASWARDPLGTMRQVIDNIAELPSREAYASAARVAAGRPPAPLPDPGSLHLGEADQEALRRAIEDDRARDLALDVVDVLYQVLRSPLAPQAAVEMARVLERIVEASLEERAYARAARVIHHIFDLAARSAEALHALEPVREHLQDRRFVRRLVQLLNDNTGPHGPPNTKDVQLLISYLGSAAAPALAELLCDVQDRRLRYALCESTAQLARYEVHVLAPVTKHARWFVPRNVAFVLGMTRNPESLKILRNLAEHPHEKVRFEALRAATQLPGNHARDVVVRALSDTDRGVRLFALSFAPQVVDAAIVQWLVQRFHDKVFRELDLGEKRAIAVALARCAGEEVLHLFRDTLARRSLFGGKKIDDTRVAAVVGMVVIGTAQANDLLTAAAKEEPALASVIEEARKEWALRGREGAR